MLSRVRFAVMLTMLIWQLGVVTAWAQTAQSPLTSQALDPGLFRDGAIKRYSGTHDAWGYVCDEVAKLKRRFCSLRSLIRNSSGTVIAAVTISTGEDGRPAGLLRMAGSSFDETGIEISAVSAVPTAEAQVGAGLTPKPKTNAAKDKIKVPTVTRVYPAACGDGVCEMIWTLPIDHIAALSGGVGLRLRFIAPKPGMSQLATALGRATPQPTEATVDARGFAAAVDASVKMAE